VTRPIHLIEGKACRTRVHVACGQGTYSELTEAHRVTRCLEEVTCRSCRRTKLWTRGRRAR
jgi:hypothetical protein